MLTEMRDKITVPQNFQQIHALNHSINQFNQLQTCNMNNMSSQFNIMQSVPYNNPNNYMLTRFMYYKNLCNIKINISRIRGARELELTRKLIIYEGLFCYRFHYVPGGVHL